MKIIVCPSCHEQASNLTVKCPHCGNLVTGNYDSQYTPKRGSGGFTKLIGVVILLAVLGGVYYYFLR